MGWYHRCDSANRVVGTSGSHTQLAHLLMPTTSIWTGSSGSARSHKNKLISLAVMCTTTDESGRRSVTSNAGRLGGVSYIHSVRGPGARQWRAARKGRKMLSRTVIVVLSLVLAASAKPPRNTRDYDYGELSIANFIIIHNWWDILSHRPHVITHDILFNSKSQKAAGYSMAALFR